MPEQNDSAQVPKPIKNSSRFVGAIIFVALLLWNLSLGGQLGHFLDLPALVFVLSLTAAGLMMTGGLKPTVDAMASVVRRRPCPTRSELRLRLISLQAVYRLA